MSDPELERFFDEHVRGFVDGVRDEYGQWTRELPTFPQGNECGAEIAFPEPLRQAQFVVYHAWHGDELLYIGVSGTPLTRLGTHAAHAPWWSQVDRLTVHEHPTRLQAAYCERRSIASKKPRYNGARTPALNNRLPNFTVRRLDRPSRSAAGVVDLEMLLLVLRARGWPDL